MELKENYTREEANFMSIVSSIIGENPSSFQEDSAFWDLVEVNFKTKELLFIVFTEDEPKNLYYTLVGIAVTHGYKFVERE
jgi:hypothetical protein